MEQRPSPGLVTFAQLLELASMDLQQIVRHELEENPALEMLEREICMLCGQPLRRGICYDCLRREAAEPTDESQPVRQTDQEFDPLMSVAAPRSLPEIVLESLVPAIDVEDLFIAEYLVGSLDERGFLIENIVNEVVRSLGVTPDRARRVLEVLQRSGPAGVGARSVRECLLLQLERLEARGAAPPLARAVIEEHLEELGRGLHTQLARALGVTTEELIAVRDFIRSRLRPFPVADGGGAETWSSPSDTPYVTPDIIIRANPAKKNDFVVEVSESRRYVVRVNAVYRRLAESMRDGSTAATMSDAERIHITQQVAKAQQFIGHLRERQSTLQRVAEAVVSRQKPFLRLGVRHLKPLTRAKIAEALGLHESTVSRAVADKYVLLPWREVSAFSQFFEPARPVEDVLRELVSTENRPHTDDELATLLARRGYHVARRTVAKYRNRLGILPSHLR
jgi:RNA polymerase sigma-54 factor